MGLVVLSLGVAGFVRSEVLKLLSASSAAYSASPKSKLLSPPSLAGSAISLVSVVQVNLKALNVRHHKVGETNEPAMYRINDDLEYAVDIYEWSGTRWESYAANDFQSAYISIPFQEQEELIGTQAAKFRQLKQDINCTSATG
ncbi:hypothetical protein RJ640_021836 [Escallonia rubra]|uniref:OST48 middle domain-containing protein n=1 Tax=Escallonia rubra TaxID=112253 RepID=A0AA88USP3_9ASTE|nr:hypothetical protein RJ640_021836 [Escallonia rubra]